MNDDKAIETEIMKGPRLVSNFEEDDVHIAPGFLSQVDHVKKLSMLNDEQELLLLEILLKERRRLELGERLIDRSLVFLSGGAGVGKSMLISCFYQTFTRLFKSLSVDPCKPTVCIAAFTASAARNVGGTTLHGLFGLSPVYDSLLPISDGSLAKLRDFLGQFRLLNIDEISMVGNFFFNRIDPWLRQIRKAESEFGGLSVICLGDLFQLPLIQDCYVLQQSRRLTKYQFQKNFWQLFKMHELKLLCARRTPNGAVFLIVYVQEIIQLTILKF